MKLQKTKAFTLVELIIVITILAILATIWFMSYQSYTSDSRDANRITTLKEISKWLDIKFTKTSNYPMPDWLISTWAINWVIYAYKWIIWNNVFQNLRMQKRTDPMSNSEYMYWINTDKTQYQIAAVLENNTISNVSNLTTTTYADLWVVAKVNGNYPGYVKYSTWTSTYIANIPSILWNNTWAVDLLNTTTKYIVNKKTNLPYKLNSTTDIWTKNANTIIQEITWTWVATLTWVNITNITSSNIWNTFSWAILASFGWDINKVTSNVIWWAVASTPTSCLWNIPDWVSKISNATSFAGWTRNYNTTAWLCTYICNTSYHTEDTWLSCISNTKSCTITNWVWSQTWNWTAWWTCTVNSCNTWYTNISNVCTAIWSTSTNPWLSCLDIKTKLASSIDWTYWIKPDANAAFQVYCDMNTDWWGWTLVRKTIGTVIVDGWTADLNKASLVNLTTDSAHIADTTYNSINPSQVWNICDGRQTIYIRNISTAWYSNHWVALSCSYTINFWTGMKKDFTSTTDSNFLYKSCWWWYSNTNAARWILSGIYIVDNADYWCYDAASNTNTTSASPVKYDNHTSTAVWWWGNWYVLIR